MGNKTIEALLRGYFCFSVNGTKYWMYHKALAARKSVHKNEVVVFNGLHIFKGWVCFYKRIAGEQP